MPKLIISNHLLAPMADLYGEYSDAYKEVYNLRPDNWEWWAKLRFTHADALAKLRAEIDRLHRTPAIW